MNLDQEKRVMLAFALSIVMLVLYKVYFIKEPPPQPKKSTPAASATTNPGTPARPAAPPPAVPAAPPAPAALPVLKGTKAEEFVVEGNLYRVTFSTVGAVVQSWVIKGYPKGEQVETVDAAACESLGFPLMLQLPDSELQKQVNQAVYMVKSSEGDSSAGEEAEVAPGATLAPPVTLTFTYSDGRVQVQKRIAFNRTNYVARLEVSVFDGQTYKPVEIAWPGGFGDQSLAPSTYDSIRQGVYGSIGSLTVVAQGKVKEPRTAYAPLELAGLEDKFFAAVFIPNVPDHAAFKLTRQEWSPPNWTEKEKPRPVTGTLVETPATPFGFRLFVGPKALDVLKAVNPPLDSLLDFGWFSVVAKPLFIGMRYIHDHWIHNYGWSIVLLTILITMAMFPLKLKSLRSAQEMQKVAPIIKGIQDKYKNYKFNDPRKQKMNEEVMKVYSEHHINPLSGCLPMLLQLPVLYGFYRVLDISIELRHAPWILWVKDLSAPDRLMVMGYNIPMLVILMTAVSYFLQRMTPMATVDPSQQRMMAFMPIFMGIMFYKLDSGLVLYWLASSAIQIAQQAFINRRMPAPQPPPAPRKAREAKA